MLKPKTRTMSDKHEKFLAELLGPHSQVMPNSGAGWHKQMDVRGSHHDELFAYAVDGKSTLRESIGVSVAMWDKAVEQSANETPMLALRFYSDYALNVTLDLIVVEAQEFKALRDTAEQTRVLEEEVSRLKLELAHERAGGDSYFE